MPIVADCCAFLEKFAPTSLSAEWDNTGLLMGDRAAPVSRVMTCLTVTEDVVNEAISKRADLIVSHHPILFRGTKRFVADSGEGRLLWPLARAGIAVYSPHTAFDNAPGGINDFLATTLRLRDIQPLRRKSTGPSFKVVVFVPESDLEAVSSAMFRAGAGLIGKYRECSFRSAGVGTFFGTEGTNPTIGTPGQRETVAEWRVEVVCPQEKLKQVVTALRQAHSYEEPAFDVYHLLAPESQDGEGRIGTLADPVTLKEFAKVVRSVLGAGATQFMGEPETPVRRVAIACGAAGEFLDDARQSGADVFLTGEMRFHDYLRALGQGMALVLPGHFATERPAVEELARRLGEAFPELEAWASHTERDPANWV